MPLTPYSGSLAEYAKGDGKSSGPLLVEDASFAGAVTLAYLAFDKPVVFRRSVFESKVDLQWATFDKGLVLEACEFRGAGEFVGLAVKGDLVLDGCCFARSEWRGLSVTQDLSAYGVTFLGEAQFSPIQVGADAHFACLGAQRTTFCQAANFSAAVVNGQLTFSSAVFLGPAYFQRVVAKGGLFALADQDTNALPGTRKGACEAAACFAGDADFHGLEAKEVRWEGVAFMGELILEGARLTADLRCDGARLEGESRFNGMQVAGQTVFSGAQVKGRAQFRQVGFGEEAIFRGVVFEQAAEFRRAVFQSRATFGQEHEEGACVFHQEADFLGRYSRARLTLAE